MQITIVDTAITKCGALEDYWTRDSFPLDVNMRSMVLMTTPIIIRNSIINT